MPLPSASARVFGAVGRFGSTPPVGGMAGLVQLPNIVAGRAAVPDMAQACSDESVPAGWVGTWLWSRCTPS
ncbi:hypothetical protein FB558_0900 [Pseudonocardia kunmingensis]|uniref:Uncharacterized protein n=1 Tax=Pseudonocardia kunmingensis TaxID=630975 RepID=A0A543DXT3_9PSEU|nr:hypothetical protein FB558_0900 [Pseudonocardia kunmingensis]